MIKNSTEELGEDFPQFEVNVGGIAGYAPSAFFKYFLRFGSLYLFVFHVVDYLITGAYLFKIQMNSKKSFTENDYHQIKHFCTLHKEIISWLIRDDIQFMLIGKTAEILIGIR